LRPGTFGIDTEVADLLVGRRVTAVAFDRCDDSIEIVERCIPTLTLCSHPDTQITSRPLPVRIFQ
jgi:hypothetical protein